jgi:hypothetical protein
MMVPFIQAGWKAHWYVYVPGTVRTRLKDCPLDMTCVELAGCAPVGMVSHTTS